MTPPMTPREKVVFKQPCKHCQRMTTVDLTALASGSGDHAELAEIATRCEEHWLSGPQEEGAIGVVVRRAQLEALLAENAALRAARDDASASCTAWSRTVGEMASIGEGWKERCVEAERKLAEAVADERARGQVIINERDKWIVELIRERDAAKAILRNAVSEAIPDAMIFAGHPDEQRYSKALDGLRIWTDRASTFLSNEAERG